MLKRAIFAFVLSGAVGLLAVGVALADNGATKVNLLADSSGSCGSGATTGTPGYGSAIIKRDGNGTLSAEVHLTNATPNHTYTLEIVQTPSGAGCFVGTTTLTTNNQGIGNAHVTATQDAGTTDAFVMINPSDGLGYITTQDVVFG
jgi:hypothetical protein